ncbi:ankyrin repeat domain-containing protein [Eremomyces bilateralis CBS 781.70]|uniref:Ankyrin repeat domain-containing protein n=1 Tax=Eremomyces bilateralis CBS 781.70 TaxID=1392243 RepID=A0A6G1GF85_9PEZI|nr:ankyrin repeat domain-containing protein [Eremomyces bilateralis CBS 781.70]KAF1816520.1 ankyrin repeat domain-containing protein [Eremomyces bilateralis CBS 781.70]
MADEGATPRELILESCRRNNPDLLDEVLAQQRSPPQIAALLNRTVDGVGNGALHIAATYGSYEVLDMLLDQEGLEIDNFDRMEKDTPLHKAVRHVNELGKERWDEGLRIVDILLDAGCDPRIRNKAKLKPVELADPRNVALRDMLRKAEFAMMAGDDVVQEDDDEGPTGSGSESD